MQRVIRYALVFVLLAVVLLQSMLTSDIASPYRAGRLAVLTESGDGESLYIVDLASHQADFLFEPGGSGFRLYWSPTGNHLVVAGSFPTGLGAWVVDPDQKKWNEMRGWIFAWGHFAGWTSDGRYALFTSYDQYGNSDSTVFDTWQWRTVITTTTSLPSPCLWRSMGGGCYRKVQAIAPKSPMLLLANGVLVDLPHLGYTQVLPEGITWCAAWSPDEKYLALVNCPWIPCAGGINCQFYITDGDGTNPHYLTHLTPEPIGFCSFNWQQEEERQVVVLLTGKARYIWNPARQEMRSRLRNPESEGLPHPPKENACGDTAKFLKGESPLGDVTAACWSPDRNLLAVGGTDALKIYDANMRLIQTVEIRGTIRSVSWSPERTVQCVTEAKAVSFLSLFSPCSPDVIARQSRSH